MPKLYSYCIPYDDGAAPNPYWGVCTLVICKPVIRRSATVGDWIVGTGSTRSPIGDIGGCVVYAMQVTDKMTMAKYDAYTATKLPGKVPNWHHHDVRRRLGDSLYDFSVQPPRQRCGVHGPGNIDRDLRGRHALLSEHFFYFGDKPERLPNDLLPIVRQGQGHQCNLNAPYFERFLAWIHSLGYKPNTLMGRPQLNLFKDESTVRACAAARCRDADDDEAASRSPC
jgi:hypothetical protein